jgi:hypothetical protein
VSLLSGILDRSIRREEARSLFRIVAAPVVELGGAGIGMTGSFLDFLERRTVLRRRRDEGRAIECAEYNCS